MNAKPIKLSTAALYRKRLYKSLPNVYKFRYTVSTRAPVLIMYTNSIQL